MGAASGGRDREANALGLRRRHKLRTYLDNL
jgi:hypothetical protein